MEANLSKLLQRWHEGRLTGEELCALNALLCQKEARTALTREWLLDATLPQALASTALAVCTPKIPGTARALERFCSWLTQFDPAAGAEPESGLGALRLWARAGLAALALGLLMAGCFVLPTQEPAAPGPGAEPSAIAQTMLEEQLPDSL